MSKRKAYRRRDPNGAPLRTQPWRLAAVMAPMEAILRQLAEHQTCDVAPNGTPIFKDFDGHWYDTCVALDGVAECFELHAERQGQDADWMRPLRQLSNKLRYAMPMTMRDVWEARSCLDNIRDACNQMTIGYAVDLLKTIRIREEMERIENESHA